MASFTLRWPFLSLPYIIGLLISLAAFPGRSIGGDEAEKSPPRSEVKPLFEDKFDGALAKEWSWLNNNPGAWRIDKDGLKLRTLPVQIKTMNVLLGPEFKAGTKLIAEVFLEIHPSVQFEHAGLKCYFDEKNWVSINSESDVVLTLHKAGKHSWQTLRKREDAFWARLVIADGKAVAFYKVKAKDEWKRVGECELPSKGNFRFGLSAGAWPKGADDWARFRDFRILPLAK